MVFAKSSSAALTHLAATVHIVKSSVRSWKFYFSFNYHVSAIQIIIGTQK